VTFNRRAKHEHWLFGKDGALLAAAVRGNTVLARELLDAGADPNVSSGTGVTALHRAAQHGHMELVNLLLSRNATPDVRTTDDRLPRDLAAANGHNDVVDALDRVMA
jgi:ankyrin repeat protein